MDQNTIAQLARFMLLAERFVAEIDKANERGFSMAGLPVHLDTGLGNVHEWCRFVHRRASQALGFES